MLRKKHADRCRDIDHAGGTLRGYLYFMFIRCLGTIPGTTTRLRFYLCNLKAALSGARSKLRMVESGPMADARRLTVNRRRWRPELILEPIRSRFGQASWRRRRDSNPRYAFGAYNGLANRRLQPLGHVSALTIRALSKSRARTKPKIAAATARACSRSGPMRASILSTACAARSQNKCL